MPHSSPRSFVPAAAGLALALASAASFADEPSAAPAAAPAAAAVGVAFMPAATTFPDALAKAKADAKPLFVDFFSDH